MVTRVLQIDSSLFGEQGVSSQLTQHLVAQLQQRHGSVAVTHRDLAREPVPHLSADILTAIGQGEGAQRTKEAQFADQLIEELLGTDILVVAAPMYNFGIPSTLKAWIDHVARAGATFRYTSAGPEGLVGDKPVYVVTTRGGVYRSEVEDAEIAYLKRFFAFIGLTDVRVIYAEGLNMGLRDDALAVAKAEIAEVVQKHEEAA